MISNAPLQAAQTDASGLATLSWTGWYTQVAGALTAFDQNGNLRNNTTLCALAPGNQWKAAQLYQDTGNNFSLDINTRASASGADAFVSAFKVNSAGTIAAPALNITGASSHNSGTFWYLNGPNNSYPCARVYPDANGSFVIDNQSGAGNWVNSLRISNAGAVSFPHPELLSFGSWQNFALGFSFNNSSTGASSYAANAACYLRIGQMVHVQFDVSMTLNNSAPIIVYFNLPVNGAGPAGFQPLGCVINNGQWNAGIAMAQGNVLPIMLYNQAAYPLGTALRFLVNGAYRAA